MAEVIMDHGVSGCFGTMLAPAPYAFNDATLSEAACPRNALPLRIGRVSRCRCSSARVQAAPERPEPIHPASEVY